MTAKEESILLHALGWPSLHRNYYICGGPGSTDHAVLCTLVEKGWARLASPGAPVGKIALFSVLEVTPDGFDALRQAGHQIGGYYE